MDRLDCVVQAYDWGDPHAIPDLLGRPATGEPQAELWMGAHPVAPSRLASTGQRLDEAIAADPSHWLGPDVSARFGRLPYLMKVLAAAEPLSIQAHPSTEQAEEGFAREEAAGLPLDAPERIYRDRSDKPELLCAVTTFEAKCGFRSVDEARRIVEDFGLDAVAAHLGAGDLGATMAWLLELPADQAEVLADLAVSAASGPARDRWPDEANWTIRMAEAHPGDVGVVLALLLNHLVLEPGEAVFLAAGNVHAYLHGVGIEIMASSDNVVRGAFTTKHVDVDELVAVATTQPSSPDVQRPEGSVHHFASDADEFTLTRIELGGEQPRPGGAPEIVFVLQGQAVLSASESLSLDRGDVGIVAAADGPYSISGEGLVFVASVGD